MAIAFLGDRPHQLAKDGDEQTMAWVQYGYAARVSPPASARQVLRHLGPICFHSRGVRGVGRLATGGPGAGKGAGAKE